MHQRRARSSVVEHTLHTGGVASSILAAPTIQGRFTAPAPCQRPPAAYPDNPAHNAVLGSPSGAARSGRSAVPPPAGCAVRYDRASRGNCRNIHPPHTRKSVVKGQNGTVRDDTGGGRS